MRKEIRKFDSIDFFIRLLQLIEPAVRKEKVNKLKY